MSKVGIIEFDKLVIGDYLMKSNDHLREWSCPLPKLTHGNYMFYNCDNLTSFSGDLSSLQYAERMFSQCIDFTTFECSNLNSLKEAPDMFSACDITSFNYDLPNLTNADSMFSHSYELKSFSGSVNKLQVADSMFQWSPNLETVNANFPSVIFGDNMFYDCNKLENFNCNDLGNFVVGGYIFSGCSLSAQSVMNIANSIKDVNSLLNNAKVITDWTGYATWDDGCYKHKGSGQYLYIKTIDGQKYKSAFGWGEPGQIWIDVKSDMSSADLTILSTALDTFAAKGWSVYSGTIPESVSISEEGGENTSVYVQVLTDFFEKATHINTDGKPVQMCVVKSIFTTREHNYKLFPSKEEAELYYGLTPIESK